MRENLRLCFFSVGLEKRRKKTNKEQLCFETDNTSLKNMNYCSKVNSSSICSVVFFHKKVFVVLSFLRSDGATAADAAAVVHVAAAVASAVAVAATAATVAAVAVAATAATVAAAAVAIAAGVVAVEVAAAVVTDDLHDLLQLYIITLMTI